MNYDINTFVDKMRRESTDNPMAQRWCYSMEQQAQEIRMKVLRLVKYDDMYGDDMTGPLAWLICSVLPVEIAASPYGIEDSTRQGLEVFADRLINSGKPCRMSVGTKINNMLEDMKHAR